jgi:hypothetical protein
MFCELEKAPKDLSRSDSGWSSSSERGGASWYHPKKARATQSVSFPSIKSQFHILMKEWRRDTDCVSSIQEIIDNSAYRAIIDLGKPALPFILADLRDEGALWFEALRQIAGEDPVTPDIRGNFTKMRERWILWGQSRRYL